MPGCTWSQSFVGTAQPSFILRPLSATRHCPAGLCEGCCEERCKGRGSDRGWRQVLTTCCMHGPHSFIGIFTSVVIQGVLVLLQTFQIGLCVSLPAVCCCLLRQRPSNGRGRPLQCCQLDCSGVPFPSRDMPQHRALSGMMVLTCVRHSPDPQYISWVVM